MIPNEVSGKSGITLRIQHHRDAVYHSWINKRGPLFYKQTRSETCSSDLKGASISLITHLNGQSNQDREHVVKKWTGKSLFATSP